MINMDIFFSFSEKGSHEDLCVLGHTTNYGFSARVGELELEGTFVIQNH